MKQNFRAVLAATNLRRSQRIKINALKPSQKVFAIISYTEKQITNT